jgi:signal transduction histidine kinase
MSDIRQSKGRLLIPFGIQEAPIEAEKFAVTGRLVASIAHEIRNPVDAVINLFHLLRSESSETKRSEYIRQAEGELGRVSEIATNTLRFYRASFQ